MNTDMYGNCNTCGQKLGTATAGHTCVIDVSKLPKYYSEAEYNLLLSSEQAWRDRSKKADTLIKLWIDAYNNILVEHHMNYSSLSQEGEPERHLQGMEWFPKGKEGKSNV